MNQDNGALLYLECSYGLGMSVEDMLALGALRLVWLSNLIFWEGCN